MQIKLVLNGKEINLTGDNTIIKSNNFNVDKNGNMRCNNATVNGKITSNDATITGGDVLITTEPYALGSRLGVTASDGSGTVQIDAYEIFVGNGSTTSPGRIGSNIGIGYVNCFDWDTNQKTEIKYSGINTPTLTQTSKENMKKNFELLSNALKIIEEIDIYKYNLKNEKDTDKKHIGFVIGDKYNYSKEITSIDNTGVDIYSFTSLCCKAIQEQQEQIEELKKEIKILKGEKNG